MKPIEILKKLKTDSLKEKHPNFPPHAIPQTTYSDKSANGLTKCIIDWLQLNGHQAERINTMGVARVEKGIKDEVFNRGTPQKITWTKGNGTKGSADISAVVRGISLKIEVKIGNDRISKHQEKYADSIRKSGGVYFIAKDFNSFYDFYLKLMERIKDLNLFF